MGLLFNLNLQIHICPLVSQQAEVLLKYAGTSNRLFIDTSAFNHPLSPLNPIFGIEFIYTYTSILLPFVNPQLQGNRNAEIQHSRISNINLSIYIPYPIGNPELDTSNLSVTGDG